jgi:crotonobetainyl-CoA:carnitine CoA-transferase CaiB-like acyl-CoA transferase
VTFAGHFVDLQPGAGVTGPPEKPVGVDWSMRWGPLSGVRVLQIAGLGAVPFTGMMLADMGADVVRVDRPTMSSARQDEYEKRWRSADPRVYVLDRGRRSVMVDLKSEQGQALVLEMAGCADIMLEGFRPGVMEQLGLGPEPCLARNRALVYGRRTGWGRDGSPRPSPAGPWPSGTNCSPTPTDASRRAVLYRGSLPPAQSRALDLRDQVGLVQPAPAPRLGRTPAELSSAPPVPGEHSRSALREWGVDSARVDELLRAGVVQQTER